MARGPAECRAGAKPPLIKWMESVFLRVPLGVCEHQGQICIFKNVMLIY